MRIVKWSALAPSLSSPCRSSAGASGAGRERGSEPATDNTTERRPRGRRDAGEHSEVERLGLSASASSASRRSRRRSISRHPQAERLRVQHGVAGIPTAWTARWDRQAVIALGSDVDCIPQASQKPGVAYHDPIIEGAPCHGEGHNSGSRCRSRGARREKVMSSSICRHADAVAGHR